MNQNRMQMQRHDHPGKNTGLRFGGQWRCCCRSRLSSRFRLSHCRSCLYWSSRRRFNGTLLTLHKNKLILGGLTDRAGIGSFTAIMHMTADRAPPAISVLFFLEFNKLIF